MNSALVTGATGLLGRHLIAALSARGVKVRALVLPHDDVGSLARDVDVRRGDVCDPATLPDAMRGVDCTFNLAGLMGVWRPLADYTAVNVSGAVNVCRAAHAAGVGRIVHVSSWTVYGMDRGVTVDEDFPLAPFPEPYAITKAEGDRAVQHLIAECGIPAVIVRPATFFGQHDRLHFGRIADRVRGGRGIIVGSGTNALPFAHVDDIVSGLILAATVPTAAGRAYNIGNDAPISQKEFLRAVADEIGVTKPLVHVPYAVLYAAAVAAEGVEAIVKAGRQPVVTRLGIKVFGTDNRHSIRRAQTELGFRAAVPLREGIRRAAEWYRAA